MDGIYSVFRGDRWIYYRGFTKPKANAPEKNMLSGSFEQSLDTSKGVEPESLGMTPEEAAMGLPHFSIRVGEGERPMGEIASGPRIASSIGKFIVGAGACALILHLTKPTKEEKRASR